MLAKRRVDLHIHSCLSPCADNEATPQAIVARAAACRLELIAISDHNSVKNFPALQKAAQGSGIQVLCAMEITSAEEVHVLAVFPGRSQGQAMEKVLARHLKGENDPAAFGEQIIIHPVTGRRSREKNYLLGAVELSLEKVVEEVRQRGGLAIASHIDREGFGVLGQLGMIPPGCRFDALEVSWRVPLSQARERFAPYRDRCFVTFSDAHFLPDIGRASSEMLLAEANFSEVATALKGEKGRAVTG